MAVARESFAVTDESQRTAGSKFRLRDTNILNIRPAYPVILFMVHVRLKKYCQNPKRLILYKKYPSILRIIQKRKGPFLKNSLGVLPKCIERLLMKRMLPWHLGIIRSIAMVTSIHWLKNIPILLIVNSEKNLRNHTCVSV
jgi:hypothetical protein